MAKIKIPPVVKMGAHEYQVKFARGLSARRGAVAETAHPVNRISIDPDRVASKKVQAFWHEVVHVGWDIFGGGQKKPTEGQCDAFAEAVAQVMMGAMGIEFDFSLIPEEEA